VEKNQPTVLHWFIVSKCQPVQVIRHILQLNTSNWEEIAKKTLIESMASSSETCTGVVFGNSVTFSCILLMKKTVAHLLYS